MKLAEALIERASLKAKMDELSSRMTRNITVQEGDTPAEDVSELMKKFETICDKFTKLVKQINKTNQTVTTAQDESLADLIAQRDTYKKFAKTYRNLYDEAFSHMSRYSRNEIRYSTTMDISIVQQEANDYAKKYRQLDTQIRGMNWTNDLIE